MTSPRYYHCRDLGNEVIFDFSSLVQTTPRADLEKYFADCLIEEERIKDSNATANIKLMFLRDTLSNIRADRPLVTTKYFK